MLGEAPTAPLILGEQAVCLVGLTRVKASLARTLKFSDWSQFPSGPTTRACRIE
jgi:hypothetical protein